jgi:hypothetical protein
MVLQHTVVVFSSSLQVIGVYNTPCWASHRERCDNSGARKPGKFSDRLMDRRNHSWPTGSVCPVKSRRVSYLGCQRGLFPWSL